MLLSALRCPICEQQDAAQQGRCPTCRSLTTFESVFPAFNRISVVEPLVQEGIERARRQIKADLRDGHAHYALGLAYLNFGLREQGIDELCRAAELLPEQHRIRYELALASTAGGDATAAIDHLDRALKLAPELVPYRYLEYYLQGVFANERQKVRVAVGHWIQAFRLDPAAPIARETLQQFVHEHQARLSQSIVAKQPGLTPEQQEALNILSGRARAATQRVPGAPRTPHPLGKTSMRLLRKYAPARAAALEQMYTERVAAHAAAVEQYEQRRHVLTAQNETALAAHEERLRHVRANLPLLAELCAIALELEIQQQEVERRQQEAERRRAEQAEHQRVVTAKRTAAPVAAPPVKERELYRTNATYVQGLPVGRKGDVVQLVVTSQRIVLIRSAMLDKWTHEMPLSALTEAVDDTVKGMLSKEPRLRLSYRDSQGMIAHVVFTGLKVDASLKAILQARSAR